LEQHSERVSPHRVGFRVRLRADRLGHAGSECEGQTNLKCSGQIATDTTEPLDAWFEAQSAGEQTVTGEDSSTKEDSHRGGQHEGIKVHGHWTIEVRNANGSLATHREFENSLQSSGGALLANVLAAGATAGAWVIHLDGSTNASSPCLPAPANTTLTQAGSTSCVIVPSQFASLAANFGAFGTLNVSASSSGTGQLVLNGTAVAAQNGAVGNVSTYLGLCGNTTPPSTCSQNIGNLLQFTAVTLSAAQVVQVSVGQTIAVTVNISFS